MQRDGWNYEGMAKTRYIHRRPTTAKPLVRRKREPPTLYLEAWIRRLGLKPRAVARGVPLNEGYLSELISGAKYPSPGMLNDIAKFLKVPEHLLKQPPPGLEILSQLRGFDPSIISRLIPDQAPDSDALSPEKPKK